MKSDKFLLAAVVGSSALAAAAVLLIAVHDQSAGYVELAKSVTMTVGSTSTETTPSTIEATTMAAPAMTGPAALPAEEQGPAAP